MRSGENAGWDHAIECSDLKACPWCGQANPDNNSEGDRVSAAFNAYTLGSRNMRQKAIVASNTKRNTETRSHIGSSIKQRDQLPKSQPDPQKYLIQIHLWEPKDKDAPYFTNRWVVHGTGKN